MADEHGIDPMMVMMASDIPLPVPLRYSPLKSASPISFVRHFQWVLTRRAWCTHPNPCAVDHGDLRKSNYVLCKWDPLRQPPTGSALQVVQRSRYMSLECDVNALGARTDGSTWATTLGDYHGLKVTYRGSPDQPHLVPESRQVVVHLPKTVLLKLVWEGDESRIDAAQHLRMWAWLWASRPYTVEWGDTIDRNLSRKSPRLFQETNRVMEVFPHPALHRRVLFGASSADTPWYPLHLTHLAQLRLFYRGYHCTPHMVYPEEPKGCYFQGDRVITYFHRRCILGKPVGRMENAAFLADGLAGLAVRTGTAQQCVGDTGVWWVDSDMRRLQIKLEEIRKLCLDARYKDGGRTYDHNMVPIAFQNYMDATATLDVPRKQRIHECLTAANRVAFMGPAAQYASCNALWSRMIERQEDSVRLAHL